VVSCYSPEFATVRPGQLRRGDNVLIVDLTTDVNRELAVMLKIRIPRLKVLFVAESSLQLAEQAGHNLVDAIAPGDRQFLWKPFTGHELLSKVDDLLAGRGDVVGRAAGAVYSGAPL
jgi:hypothetical protein